MNERAETLATHWINGNTAYVANALEALPPLQAALLVLQIAECFGEGQRSSLVRYLEAVS
jgi:hypothetical protein